MIAARLMSLEKALAVVSESGGRVCPPNVREYRVGARFPYIAQRPHGSGTVAAPRVAEALEALPFRAAGLSPELLVVRRRLLELRDVGSEVGKLGCDVEDAVHPYLLRA